MQTNRWLGLLLLLSAVSAANKAILICCSWQYENYRHFANVLALQSLLERNGYSPKDIAIFMKEDILANRRNPSEQLWVGDESLEPTKDYTPKRRDQSYYDILNLIAGEDEVLLGADAQTNLLIYITGHGGDGFIKYCNRSYFYREDITKALIRLQSVRRLGKVLFIADTCQADSLVDASQLPDNVTLISTSLLGESSHSANFNHRLNIFPIDLFVMQLTKAIKSPAIQALTFKDLTKHELSFGSLLSTVSIHGPDAYLQDFLWQTHRPSSLFL
ncbi:GPI-anchor transamidase subunit K [Nematocida homosporus]|uniref:GPI-anchor transamidase subunit K n=1 Tax=Nematocida homosporus TaxID=1912981 RepID=UPI002220BEC7|nr:GPI-anchor transamidase subunit K [Nematocida homosporus]KAI5186267.1 GPI-anchor transamidase subunit K [Nematocida homosporus]